MLKIEGLRDTTPEKPIQGEFVDAKKVHTRDSSLHESVITQLASGVRDKNRVNVFINNKFALSLDVEQVVDLQIKVGRKLSEQDLQELHQASEFGKLYQRALEWALTRPHSVWETREYLKRRQLKRRQLNYKREKDELKPLPEIRDTVMQLVLERLMSRGYVDDRKFTEYYIENRFIKKGVSQKRLKMELRKKGITDSIVEEVVESTDRSEEDELAKMIAKKRNKYDHDKLIKYLVQQGFNYQLVRDAVDSLDDGNDFQSSNHELE